MKSGTIIRRLYRTDLEAQLPVRPKNQDTLAIEAEGGTLLLKVSWTYPIGPDQYHIDTIPITKNPDLSLIKKGNKITIQ